MKNSHIYFIFSALWLLGSIFMAFFALMLDKASAITVVYTLMMMLGALCFYIMGRLEHKHEKEQEELKKEQEEKIIKWLRDNPNVLLMLTQIINRAWEKSTRNK